MLNRMGYTLRKWGTNIQLSHQVRLAFGKAKQAIRQQGKGTGKEAWVCVSPYTGATVLGYQVQQKVIDKLRKRGYHAMDYTATWIRISW